MRKLFYLIAAGSVVLTVASCGNSGSNSATVDSAAIADSIHRADSIRIADSIAKVEADSIARVDSIARADSISKAEAKKAEDNRDKSIDKDLDYVYMIKRDLEDSESAGGGTWMLHEAQAAQDVLNKLKSKENRMTPKQKKRFNTLKKYFR